MMSFGAVAEPKLAGLVAAPNPADWAWELGRGQTASSCMAEPWPAPQPKSTEKGEAGGEILGTQEARPLPGHAAISEHLV